MVSIAWTSAERAVERSAGGPASLRQLPVHVISRAMLQWPDDAEVPVAAKSSGRPGRRVQQGAQGLRRFLGQLISRHQQKADPLSCVAAEASRHPLRPRLQAGVQGGSHQFRHGRCCSLSGPGTTAPRTGDHAHGQGPRAVRCTARAAGVRWPRQRQAASQGLVEGGPWQRPCGKRWGTSGAGAAGTNARTHAHTLARSRTRTRTGDRVRDRDSARRGPGTDTVGATASQGSRARRHTASST